MVSINSAWQLRVQEGAAHFGYACMELGATPELDSSLDGSVDEQLAYWIDLPADRFGSDVMVLEPDLEAPLRCREGVCRSVTEQRFFLLHAELTTS